MFTVLRKRARLLLIGSGCLFAATAVLVVAMWNTREPDFLCHEVAFWGREDAPAVTLNGEAVTCTEIDQMMVSYGHLGVTHTASQAVDLVISDALVRQELYRFDAVVSEQEVEAYVQVQRAKCLGGSGSFCRAAILELGLDPHEGTYWKLARPIFRRDLERDRLDALLTEEMGLKQFGTDEADATLDSFYRRLRENAKIVWHDASLQRVYEEQ